MPFFAFRKVPFYMQFGCPFSYPLWSPQGLGCQPNGLVLGPSDHLQRGQQNIDACFRTLVSLPKGSMQTLFKALASAGVNLIYRSLPHQILTKISSSRFLFLDLGVGVAWPSQIKQPMIQCKPLHLVSTAHLFDES